MAFNICHKNSQLIAQLAWWQKFKVIKTSGRPEGENAKLNERPVSFGNIFNTLKNQFLNEKNTTKRKQSYQLQNNIYFQAGYGI